MGRVNKWKNIISSLSNALGGKKRAKKNDGNAFDIFPDWFKSAFSKRAENDRQTVEEKDNTTGVDSYLARKKSHKKFTPTEYNDNYGKAAPYQKDLKFSSPSEEQQINAPTNTGEYDDTFYDGVDYDDPVISTKPTPTSEKMGVPRPGPSTFIQTAKYNPMNKRLNILYTDGKIFPYHNVSPELADSILKKKNYHSPGQELLNTIFYGHGTTKADEISDINEGM